MGAAIEDSKLLTSRQDHFHANLTLMVIPLVIREHLSILLDRVGVGAFLPIAAGSASEVHANFWGIPLLELSLQKLFDQGVIFVVGVPLPKFLFSRFVAFWT